MKKSYVTPFLQFVEFAKWEIVRTSGMLLQSGVTFYDRNHFSNDRGFNGGNFVI